MKKCWLCSLSTCFVLGTALLFSACQSQQTAHMQTDCPAAGQARALETSPLMNGTHTTIVYDDIAENGTSAIKSYDVRTGQTRTIYTRPAGELMGDEHLSGDGQWIVFDTWQTNGVYFVAKGSQKLQAIRVDGQDLQTLYCTDSAHGIDTAQWSPDQKYLAFSTLVFGPGSSEPDQPDRLYLLNTASGKVQTEMALSETNASYPLTWLDATRLYIATRPGPGAHPARLYLLDITQGAHHLQTIWDNPQQANWKASLNPNDERLYLSETDETGNQNTVETFPATGGQARTIYQDRVSHEYLALCAATNNTLLITVEGSPSEGLYKMSTDGRDLTKVFSPPTSFDSLNAGCTTSNENVSRDGSMYAFNDSNARNNVEYYGIFSGSRPAMFASTYASDSVHIIGWT